VAFPTTQVYIAFNDGPYEANAIWTNVTAYVRQINIQRGRQNELSDFESGNATVVLDNRDRRFDPFYTSGPYYGVGTSLVPRRQIKIEATISSVVYPVFRGFIEGWPVSITDAGYDTTVTVQCFDALGLLADEELPDDVADFYIRTLNPRHYWPLNDPIDPSNYATTRLADFGNNPQPLSAAAGLRTSNASGLAVALPNTCNSISQSVYTPGWSFTSTNRTAPAGVVATFWKLPGADSVQWCSYDAGFTVNLYYNASSSTLTVDTLDGTYLRKFEGLAAYLDLTQPHFIEIYTKKPSGTSISSSSDVLVRIDNQNISMVWISNTLNSTASVEDCEIGVGRTQQFAIFADPPSGYVYQIDDTQGSTIQRLSLGFITEGTVARFNRVIGYTPFPSALTATPSTTYAATLSEISTGGPPVTEELQTISDSEGGNLFVSRNGTLTLTSRTAIFEGTSLTSQATFGGAGISIGTELAYRLDAKNLRNTLAVGYSGDGSVEVSDFASVTAYGTAGGSWSTQLSSVADAEVLADLLVGFSATPAVVIDPIQVNVSASDASWTTILGLELLNRITLNVVQQIGPAITFSQILQSIEHTITPDRWITTINGSVRFTNPFIIGTSLIGGTDLIV
jgi:hypothetical protein